MSETQLQAVIFDLDQTLVDSECVEHHRRRREWQLANSKVAQILPYPGIPELLKELNQAGIKVAVVTASPSTYCKTVLKYQGWGIDAVVCYHDTTCHKPEPDPILRALELLEVDALHAVSIGDRATDTLAARAAGVHSLGAMWGSLEGRNLEASRPDVVCNTVAEMRRALLGG